MMDKKNNEIDLNGYSLTRAWFDFSFENPDKVTTNHTAMYLWLVELNNRMGWAERFSSPASQTMAAIGIKSYNTYKKTLKDLVEWGAVIMVAESKNQYTSCIIALSNFDKAHNKALDKALTKHLIKQSESTVQSTSSINKQETINKEQGNTPPPALESEQKTAAIKTQIETELSPAPPGKTSYREAVKLTEPEYLKLKAEHGNEKTDWMLDKLNNAKLANKKLKYASDYHAILNWVVDAARKDFEPKHQPRKMVM